MLILKEDIIILKVYEPNNKIPKYVRQKLIAVKRIIEKSTINIPILVINKEQKITKDVAQ